MKSKQICEVMSWCSVSVIRAELCSSTWRLTAILLPSLLCLLGVLGPVDASGPPPGAAGTIDWRYPDAVMSVPMPCNAEGSFRHPIFCNWYYRCYDPYSIGFYRRAFFVCAPGTEFAEPLEQCVWRGSSSNDNNGFPCSYLDDSWPQNTGSEPDEGQSDASAAGCEIVVNGCRNDHLCLPEFMPRVAYAVSVRVCRQADKICPTGSGRACNSGEIWDMTNEVCWPVSHLCTEDFPSPIASYDTPNIHCNYEITTNCNDFVSCRLSDTSKALPFRYCSTAVRTCSLDTGVSSEPIEKETGLCKYKNYDLFLEQCENRFDRGEVFGRCDSELDVSTKNVSVRCNVIRTACDEYVSCETGERFTGCTNYYLCSSRVFAEDFPCPLGQVFQITTGTSGCMPIRSAAVPRLEGNTTCVSTGSESLLDDPIPEPIPGRSGRDFTRKKRSAIDPLSEKRVDGRAIESSKNALGTPPDSLLPTYYLDVVHRAPSQARKLASPSVPVSLISLANSLRKDLKDSNRVEILPIPVEDSEQTLTQLPSEYLYSSHHSEPSADTTVSDKASDIKTLEANSTAESNTVVKMDEPLCQFAGERPLPQNFSEVLQCSDEAICDLEGRPLVTLLGCSTLVQCLQGVEGWPEPEYLSCRPGHFFVPEELRCRDHAHYGGVPCPEVTSPPDALTCSAEFEILELPDQEWQQHCSSYPRCSGSYGAEQVGVSLCSAFYQCFGYPGMKTFQPVLMGCQPPQLFSYQHRQCLIPTSPLLCT